MSTSAVPALVAFAPPPMLLRLVGNTWEPAAPAAEVPKRLVVKLPRSYRLRNLTRTVLAHLKENPIEGFFYHENDGPLVRIDLESDRKYCHVTKAVLASELERAFTFKKFHAGIGTAAGGYLHTPVPSGLVTDIMARGRELADIFPDARMALDVKRSGLFLGWFCGLIAEFGTAPQMFNFHCSHIVEEAKRLGIKQTPRTPEAFGKLIARLAEGGFWRAACIEMFQHGHDRSGTAYGARFFPDQVSPATSDDATTSRDGDGSAGFEPEPDLTNASTL